MTVDGPAGTEEPRETGTRGEQMADKPGRRRPPAVRLSVPTDWPEVVAHVAGRRLFRDGEDEVPTLIRSGLPIDRKLWPPEVRAMMELGWATFERWLLEGWRAEQSREG